MKSLLGCFGLFSGARSQGLAVGTDGLVDGGAGEGAPGLEVDEEVEDLAAGEAWGMGCGEMLIKLSDPTEVGFDGAGSEAPGVDEAGEVLEPDLRVVIRFFFISSPSYRKLPTMTIPRAETAAKRLCSTMRSTTNPTALASWWLNGGGNVIEVSESALSRSDWVCFNVRQNMITVKISAITYVVEFDRQTDLHLGASIVTVTGNNSSMDRLRSTIFSDDDKEVWLRLTDDDYTSVNVYKLGDEKNPHYGS